ncbi:WAT1-related protein At5g64700 [Impatiens glandulifera]|uniref:WAT1-related protein At5g64700 n=1 Tax=Impatiens glandulifera TaxID=253017 RepID=UPI001FB0DDA0|nr:WAT1-related protein At5g64700 [Impatiens glandulifera]
MMTMMEKRKPYLVVILIQLIYTGMFLLSKAAMDVGMNSFIFVFYRQAIATLFLIPITLFLEWKNAPPLSFQVGFKIFMLSFIGITMSLNLYSVAVVYTSASLGAATANSLPAITFFLALLMRMEVVKVKKLSGIAKVFGIAICMGGVALLAFYTGPFIESHYHLFKNHFHGANTSHSSSSSNSQTWVKGCFLMILSNSCWGLWIVLQGGVVKCYPSKLLLTTLQCFFSSIVSFVIAISMERDLQKWKLGWNIELISVAYCGIMVTGVTYYLQAWVIEKKGPVFLAMSTPLTLVFTIFSSYFLLGEIISLGRVLGGILLVVGLYSVLWGKNREEKEIILQEKVCSEPIDIEAMEIPKEEKNNKIPE